MSHYQGPWICKKYVRGGEWGIVSDNGRVLALFDDGLPGHDNAANAMRVADCVNALKEISDPYAFVRAAKEVGKRYSARIWRSMSTFTYPQESYDYDAPKFLFYDPKLGCVVGRCIRTNVEPDEQPEFRFEYDRDALTLEPSHWMPLPAAPSP